MAEFAVDIVQCWHTRLNDGRADDVVALVHPQVEIGGPRGTARGAQTVGDWIKRANIRLLPEQWFAQGNQIVVAEMGEWFDPASGEVTSRQPVATAFTVDEAGLITRIIRHDTLPAALEDTCMELEDEIQV